METPKPEISHIRIAPKLGEVDIELSHTEGKQDTQEVVAREKLEVHENVTAVTKTISPEQEKNLLQSLKTRFLVNSKLHPEIKWDSVEKALLAAPEALWSLYQLEETGGEPDVFLDEADAFVFGDCSVESPLGRRNVVYDEEMENDFKKAVEHRYPPYRYNYDEFNGNARDKAARWGVDLMSEKEYRRLLFTLGACDIKSSSYLKKRENGQIIVGLNGGREEYARNRDSTTLITTHVNEISVGVPHNNINRGFRCVLRVKKIPLFKLRLVDHIPQN